MLTVEIVNYKTIEKVRFEFEGFASIVGRNRVGKSAILGAIRACLTNTVDKGAIRRGCTFTEVRLVHDHSSLDCFWHYEEGGTYYIVNGKTFEKLNGAIPPPLLALGFGPLEAGEEKVHLWDVKQFKSLFLVDEGRSNFATDLLAKILKIDAVYKAKDLVAKDGKEARAKHKIRKADLVEAENSVNALSRFPGIEKSLAGIGASFVALEAREASVTLAKGLQASLGATRTEAVALNKVRTVPAPSQAPAQASLASLAKGSRLFGSWTTGKKELQALAGVKGVPEVAPPLMASEHAKALAAAQVLLARKNACLTDIAVLEAHAEAVEPRFRDLAPRSAKLEILHEAVRALQEAEDAISGLALVDAVPTVGDAPDTSAPVALKALLARLKEAAKEHRVLQRSTGLRIQEGTPPGKLQSLRALRDSAVEAGAMLVPLLVESSKELLSEFETCPLCGSTLEEGAHAH
jgi:hypothetical protein